MIKSLFLKLNYYSKGLPYFIIFLINLIWLIVLLPMPLVNETHFLVAKLGEISFDNFNSYYKILHTPIFYIMDWLFSNYFFLSLSAIFLNVFSYCLIFFLFNKIVKDRLILLLTMLFFSPIGWAFIVKIAGLVFVDPPAIFGFFSAGPAYDLGYFFLSHRLFLLIFHILSIYFYIQNKNYLFFISLLFLNFVHANTGMFISASFIFSELILFIRNKNTNFYRFFSILIALFIPIFSKLKDVFSSKSDLNFLTNSQWYENMIKNENDFSILYQVAYNGTSLAFAYLLSIFFIYVVHKKKIIHYQILYLFSFPFIAFLLLGILEFASVYFDNFTFIYPVIVLQPGYKLLSLCYLPLLLIVSLAIKSFNFSLLKKEFFFLNFLFIFLILSSFVFFIKNKNKISQEAKKILNSYNYKILSTIDYLKISKIKHNPSYIEINNIDKVNFSSKSYKNKKSYFDIIKIDKLNSSNITIDRNYESFNNINVLADIVKAINDYVPEYFGIIVPPYQGYFRDCLPKQRIFYQNKHDGNIMMGGKFISNEGIHRMKLLLKKDYTELGSTASGLFEAQIRKIYLDLKLVDLLKIKKEYPSFNYFLTESSHKIEGASLIFSNKYYNLYLF
jgi:hypothetical protein